MRASTRPIIGLLSLGLTLLIGLTGIGFAYAGSGDLYMTDENLILSDNTVVHQQTVRIYATVTNDGTYDLLGSVQFKNTTTGNQIGSDQAVSVLSGKTDTVFVDWTPSAGTYTVTATVHPWDSTYDDPSNNQASFTTTVDYDYDGDGVGNAQDPDDDNDDVPDSEDEFPLDENESKDTDGDGTGNNADDDDDNDGILDVDDGMPEDPNESSDTDGDGIGNNTDDDDDNDNLSDEYEISTSNTDPYNADSDGDTRNDDVDLFPNDENDWADNDSDGIGDNKDPNDDNDDLYDTDDEFPENHGPVIVLEQYYEDDPESGDRLLILDASQSYDPDGDNSQMIYRWVGKEGRLIGETAIMELLISANTLFPATLMILDDQGESRSQILQLGSLATLKTMGWILFIILVFILALVWYFKYTASASKKKPVKQVKKKRPKSNKTSSKK